MRAIFTIIKLMLHIKQYFFTLLALFSAVQISAAEYVGRVVDINGQPVSYATVYPIADPIAGTATNDEGGFRFTTDLPNESEVIISFIGYEKQILPLAAFTDSITIVLQEQPIALEETVVAAKASKQRNKRKKMATLLHAVYVQMQKDFADEPASYRIVSDVRMNSEGEAWGMEQMIAKIINIPGEGHEGRDSVQFAGEYCKRYFKQSIRQLADSIYKTSTLENMDKNARKMATAIDSGVVVHKGLWEAGNIRYDFEKTVNDIRNWTVSNESEGETVLTHTEKHNYFGVAKLIITRHYILDSESLSVRRFSEQAEGHLNIPFGIKLNADQIRMLNLLNMGEQQIEKFRLRKADALVKLNTIYQRRNGHLYILEKNLRTDARIVGAKQVEIPMDVSATQRVTSLQTEGVQPMKKSQMTRRVPRQIVEIY